MKMDAAINIGNSNIGIAVAANDHRKVWRIATDLKNPASEIAKIFSRFHKLVDRCILSSVKPDLTETVCDALQPFCRIQPIVASLENGFLLDYSCYEGLLGIDRAICCEAAYLQTQTPFIVVDSGTATTLNIVDDKNCFIGGMIFPGVQMGLSALSENTALLPHMQPKSYVPLIGTNTEECLLAGTVYGTALLLDNAISNVWSRLGMTGETIITGGNASAILSVIRTKYHYEENLIFKGLLTILERNTKQCRFI